jgi:hypothetical protein
MTQKSQKLLNLLLTLKNKSWIQNFIKTLFIDSIIETKLDKGITYNFISWNRFKIIKH